MVNNNLVLRIISAVILGALTVFCIIIKGVYLSIFIQIALAVMIFEWVKINPKKNTFLFAGGLLYIIIPMLYWAVLVTVPYNTVFLMWILIIVWSADIFAYFGGRLFKGAKLAPNISPNKTWSGAITGCIFSSVISCVYLNYFFEWNNKYVFISVLLAIASVLGDLLESLVKRRLNVKDTGNILPGHGGMCDRLDSFLLVSYFYIILKVMFL